MIDTPIQPTVPAPAPADLNSLLLAQLAPVAVQAAEHAVAVVKDATTAMQVTVDTKHGESLALIGGLQAVVTGISAEVAANKAAIEAGVGRAGVAVVNNIEHDPWTQRGIVAALLLAGLFVLVGAAMGNATCNRWIAGAPLAFGSAVLWVSNAGLSLPKLPTKSATPAN